LTFFTIPKPFRGHLGIIQRNAIHSWTLLRPRCEIILFGNDEGTAAAAQDFGVGHVAKVAANEYGTPLVSDVFAQAQQRATNDVLCYINADIIVMQDLLIALRRIHTHDFLMLGQRWDVDITEPWNFADSQWEATLRATVQARGSLHPHTGVDYYVFRKGIWRDVPPFAVGRAVYDNWFIWSARARGVPVIDATSVVTSVHQNHERTYSSLGMRSPDTSDDFQSGLEAKRNLELAGGRKHVFTLYNANWRLTRRGLVPAVAPRYLWTRLKARIRLALL